MNNIVESSALENLYLLFVFACFLALFWLIEAISSRERRAALFILFIPPTLIFYTIKYWYYTRSRCFFAALLALVIIMINSLIGSNFALKILHVLQIAALWPYYLVKYFI